MDPVSVVIPAYKAAAIIEPTVDCVLAQTHPDVEVIVVDDGSPDNTSEVVAKYGERVRCVRKPNGGVASARNAGFAVSHGAFVLFLDQDDLIARDQIEKLVGALRAHPEWGVVYSAAIYIDETGTKDLGDIYLPKQGHLLKDLVLRRVALPSTGVGLIRREVIENVGGYDEQRNTVADIDLWIRIAWAGYAFGYVPERLFFYRIQSESMTSQVKKQEIEDFSLLEKIYGHPTVPDELVKIKDESYAAAYYENAARYYRAGDAIEGKNRLSMAITAAPSLARDERWLRDWISFNVMSPRTHDPWTFVQMVFDNLPPEAQVLRELRNKAVGDFHIASAFDAFRTRRYKDVLPHLWPGLRGEPRILQNRGFLAISVKSVLRILSGDTMQIQ